MARSQWGRQYSRNRPQSKRFLILVEGKVTETQYLLAVKRLVLRSDEITIECRNTEPIGMVKRAKDIQRALRKPDKYDAVWCIFDVEAKRDQQARYGLDEACDEADRTKGSDEIRCAISNPCFEIWLLWHETDQNAPIYSTDVQRKCIERNITCGKDGKHLSDAANLVRTGFTDAKTRAEAAFQMHDRDGKTKPEDRNPSSGVYKLIDAIYTAFPPRI
jgi:hypothetical protein